MYMDSLDTKTALDVAGPEVIVKVLQEIGVHGDLIAVMRQVFKPATSISQMLAGQRGGRAHRDDQLRSVLRADNFWITSDSRTHLETMMKELIVTGNNMRLEPKPES